MKKILHIIDTTGPGGAETVFIDLVTRLSSNKFIPVVVIRGKGWVYDELIRRGIEPILLDAKGSFNWRYLLGLRKIIKNEKIDLIQSHLLGSNVYSALAGLITRTPVVAVFHGTVDIGDNERLKSLKFAAINWGSQRVVAVSKKLSDNILARTPIDKTKIQIIYNGIIVEDFNEPTSDRIRKEFNWEKDVIIVGSLGNVRTAKAYDVLLQAAAQLKNKEAKFKFVIAGHYKPGLYDRLLEQRTKLGLEDTVHFLGFNNSPAEFLSNLNLFLLSSRSEGFSIATIQAMASGVPVIATKSGGPEEIISHSDNGWLVEVENPTAIADALEMLVHEPALLNDMSKRASIHVNKSFNMQTALSAYEQIYTELIQR